MHFKTLRRIWISDVARIIPIPQVMNTEYTHVLQVTNQYFLVTVLMKTTHPLGLTAVG